MAYAKTLSKNLTTHQRATLNCITAYIQAHDGVSPTLDEIASMLGGVSKVTAFDHVRQLARKGFINRTRGARSIVVVGRCPCCGSVIEADKGKKGTANHDGH